MPRWTAKELNGFQAAAQSLKLYRRAELPGTEADRGLIDALYVDPLPQDHVLQTVLKANTTFLIGRKGTGKSTVFQRVQRDILAVNSATSAYVDIKTLFESSQIDQGLLERLAEEHRGVSHDAIQRLLLYKSFLKMVIDEIKSELRKRAESSLWERVKATFSGGLDELFSDLDELMRCADEERFTSVLAARTTKVAEKRTSKEESRQSDEAALSIGNDASFGLKAGDAAADERTQSRESEYADVMMRMFSIKEFLSELKRLLEKLGIRHLYILVDDFSELPEDAMHLIVDALLAPLNNWSDEFVKFKVAAYPGRVYYGAIDKTKIDEVFLDLYRLYGSEDVATMEEKAADFTRRLVERRLNHYARCGLDTFLDRARDDVWRQLFFATTSNPRILGYLLHYLYETQLIYDRPITTTAIRDAAKKYYEDKIETYFAMNQFLHEAFEERSSIFGLKELLESIVGRAKELRTHKSAVMDKIQGQPPTSHFHVLVPFDGMLLTLELNFFLTKYYEMSDRDGRKVSVYALNYGLCQKYTIAFGRPEGQREFRLYFVERVFDYTPLLQQYLEKNQEIVCDRCGEKFGLDKLEALRMYRMRCPACGEGTCRLINLSRKYETLLRSVEKEKLLPATELGILHTLHTEGDAMFAADIAAELDCSYQLVGRRGRNLSERGLVRRAENESGRRTFEINPAAEETYFVNLDETARLDVPE
jgi:DNA-directed RNA polymerase subunit RPC12/RpoP